MAMISLLVCSRISGNKNFALFNLLESLKRMSSNYENFEVLVKFDSDDKRVGRVLPKLDTYPFKIKYIIEPRGRGYIDLHGFYNRLFSLVDERSVVIGAMADDFEVIYKGWDEVILEKAKTFEDQVFIIHGRPHPPTSRENYKEQKFNLDFDIDSIEDLAIIDEAPFWSRKLLDICGGLGHVSFTDAWTLCLEYFLFHRYGINRTLFTEQPIAYRKLYEGIDQPISTRWWSDRAYNFAFIRSSFYKTLVEYQALNIFLNLNSDIEISKQQFVPSPKGPSELSLNSSTQRQQRNAYRRKFYMGKLFGVMQKLIGPRMYGVLKGWWYSLKNGKST